jgi:hypothetical protein
MEIFISIDGVLRNIIQKFDYHYQDYFIDTEVEEGDERESFEYGKEGKIQNDNLLNYYKFQSKEEFENFVFIDYPIEIFGHATNSYQNVFLEFNKFVYENKEHNITLVGLDELGKAKSATLFYLSRNGCMSNNIKFITSSDISNLWNKCDLWITDNKKIIDACPKNKKAIKFNTTYNEYFTNKLEINKLTEIDKLWLKSSENFITSTLTRLVKYVEPVKQLKMRKMIQKLLKSTSSSTK